MEIIEKNKSGCGHDDKIRQSTNTSYLNEKNYFNLHTTQPAMYPLHFRYITETGLQQFSWWCFNSEQLIQVACVWMVYTNGKIACQLLWLVNWYQPFWKHCRQQLHTYRKHCNDTWISYYIRANLFRLEPYIISCMNWMLVMG